MNAHHAIPAPWGLSLLLLASGCGADSIPDSAPREDVAREAPAIQRPTILFVGTSLTAGFGLAPEDSYPARIQRRIEAEGWDFEVVNAGVSGDTTSDGVSRLDWLMRRTPDVVVLELGANDGLRGVPVELIEKNLGALIDRIRERAPDADIVLAGMQLPPNLGAPYTTAFRALFPRVAAGREVTLLPFLLDGVAGERALNQNDGIHPNADGQAIVASNVWQVLRPILQQRIDEEDETP